MKEGIIGLLMLICLILGYVLGTVRLNTSTSFPKRPASVPASSFWLGGDKGEWVECSHLQNQDYRVRVFADESGYVLFSGIMRLECPTTLSEQDIKAYASYYNEDDDGAYVVLSIPCKLRGKWSDPGTTKGGENSGDTKLNY